MTSLVTSDDLPHLLNALLAMQSTRIVYQNEVTFAHHESQKGPETHLQKIKSARSQTTGISNGSVDESTGGAVLYPSPWSYKPGKRSESIMSRPGIEIHSPSSKDRPSSKFRAQKKIVQLDS